MSCYDHALRGAVVITVGATDFPVGRYLAVNATVAGDAVLRMFDGSTHTINVAIGYTTFPYAVRGITSAGATAVFSNLI